MKTTGRYLLLILLVIFSMYLVGTSMLIGKTINKYFPCHQNPNTSFPCYGKWDSLSLIVLGIVGAILVGLLMHYMIKQKIDNE